MTKEAWVVNSVEIAVVTYPHDPNGARLLDAYYVTVSSVCWDGRIICGGLRFLHVIICSDTIVAPHRYRR